MAAVKLKPARFRGVSFWVNTADYTGGRRTVIHQFPGRDVPLPEDMGRKAREFTLDAFVLGPDYAAQRDALREALETSGPGTLEHPQFGRIRAQPGDVRLRESTEEGGMARFTVTFHEAGQLAPVVSTDTAGKVKAAAQKSLAASIADFGKNFSALQMAAEHVQELEQNVSDVLGAVERLTTDVTDNISALIRSPANLAAAIAGSLNRLRAAAQTPQDAFAMYRSLFGAAAVAPPAPYATPSRARQAESRAALERFVRRVAVAEAGTSLSDIGFNNATEAAGLRNDLTGALDGLLGDAPDDLFGALTDLRAAAVRDVTARGANLARVVTVTPARTLPALVLAHQLYGDPNLADDIVTRNRIRHPGFVAGGEPLEVLSNA